MGHLIDLLPYWENSLKLLIVGITSDTRVDNCVVKSKRSIWRLRTITDFVWAIVNFIGVFFATMFSMEKSDAYKKGSASGKKWDGGGPGGPGSGGPYGGGSRGPSCGLDNLKTRLPGHPLERPAD
ncbi:hypothetical protein CsSME_00014936 [Camellia sinensis var. sinensis]